MTLLLEIQAVEQPPEVNHDPECWPRCPWCGTNEVGKKALYFEEVETCSHCGSEYKLTHGHDLDTVYKGIPTWADEQYAAWWRERHGVQTSPTHSPSDRKD